MDKLALKLSKFGNIRVVKEDGERLTVLITGEGLSVMPTYVKIMDTVTNYAGDKYPVLDIINNDKNHFLIVLKQETSIISGVSIIADERQRQIEKEGWTPEHDNKHQNNELADAAICYCVDPDLRDSSSFPWPWDESWFKPTPEDRIRELAKAGSLIAAEIDRLKRKGGYQ